MATSKTVILPKWQHKESPNDKRTTNETSEIIVWRFCKDIAEEVSEGIIWNLVKGNPKQTAERLLKENAEDRLEGFV